MAKKNNIYKIYDTIYIYKKINDNQIQETIENKKII